ncbi:hypothetical protein ACFV6D_31615 [Kitasatospora sp. NPDC059812]|uniref:hypothetical protein n=1 Tax=unclassified Kitasatospora TaxID=2633591 RepID=UPI0036553ED3
MPQPRPGLLRRVRAFVISGPVTPFPGPSRRGHIGSTRSLRDGVYDSVRSEALLAGIQDYELLHQLSATKPVLARALIGSLISGTTNFSTSGAPAGVS